MIELHDRFKLSGSKDFWITHAATGILFEGNVHHFAHLEVVASEIAKRFKLEIGLLDDAEAEVLLRSNRGRNLAAGSCKLNMADAWADAIIHEYQPVIHAGDNYDPQSVWFEMNIWANEQARTEQFAKLFGPIKVQDNE